MNSLSLGFFYVFGMAWCLTECCIRAVAGNPLPAILFLVAFLVIFSVFGCLNVSRQAAHLLEVAAATGLAVALFLFSVQTGGVVGAVKILFALAFILGAIVSVLSRNGAVEGRGS